MLRYACIVPSHVRVCQEIWLSVQGYVIHTAAVRTVAKRYIVRCLYSKTWSLREAALMKLDLELNASTPHTNSRGHPPLLAESV